MYVVRAILNLHLCMHSLQKNGALQLPDMPKVHRYVIKSYGESDQRNAIYACAYHCKERN
jgi:hypothetical protein